MPRGYFGACLGAVVVWPLLPGMLCGALYQYTKNLALKRCVLGVALLFFASYGHLLDFVPSVMQKMPPRGVGFRGE